MSVMVSVQDAKTHLSRLLDQVQAGDEVVITRRGVPTAVLNAVPAKHGVLLGFMPGAVNEEQAMAPLDDDELRLWGVE
jgi:prevent-host-death family protein